MRSLGYVLCAAVAGVSAAVSQCNVRTAEGCVRAIGSSGKILYCPGGEDVGSSDENKCFVLRLRKFEEKDADGEVITAHRVNNLGNGGMSVGAPNSSYTFPATCDEQTHVCGTDADNNTLTAVQIPISAPLSGGKAGRFATLDVTVYIMTSNGTLTFGDEQVDVKAGFFKFDIKATNYMPCGTGAGFDDCKKGQTALVGDKFSFDIEVRARGNGTLSGTGGQLVSDNGDRLINFAKYRLQAVGSTSWTSEAADVKSSSDAGAQVLSYTFKVGSNVVYDPTYATGDTQAPTLSGAATAPTLAAVLLVVLCALLW